MKIGEVADQAGVSVDTMRFYERRGVLPLPARTASGYREYPPSTVPATNATMSLPFQAATTQPYLTASAVNSSR